MYIITYGAFICKLLPNMLKMPSLFWLIRFAALAVEVKYSLNPNVRAIWYPDRKQKIHKQSKNIAT